MTTTAQNNAARIAALLASESTSVRARNYLAALIEKKGDIAAVSRMTANSGEGLLVLAAEITGDEFVHYGDFTDGSGTYNCLHCDVDTILSAMESGDEVPGWYDDATVMVTVSAGNAYGYALKTREELAA